MFNAAEHVAKLRGLARWVRERYADEEKRDAFYARIRKRHGGGALTELKAYVWAERLKQSYERK